MDTLAVFFGFFPLIFLFFFVNECMSRETVAEQMHQSPPQIQPVGVSGSALNVCFLSSNEENPSMQYLTTG